MATTAAGGVPIDRDDSSPASTASDPPDRSFPLPLDATRSRPNTRIPERFRRDRERTHLGRTNRELLRILIREEYEVQDLQRLLHLAVDRLELESRRVAQAEQRILEMTERFQAVNDARLASVEDSARANADVNLYKFQYQVAQQEISRAQDTLKVVEEQRDDATAAAAKARDAARKYREKQLVYSAREEGRRIGFEEGLQHGTRRYDPSRAIGYEGRSLATRHGIESRLLTEEPYNDEYGTDDELSPGSLDFKTLPPTPYASSSTRKTHKERLIQSAAVPSITSLLDNTRQGSPFTRQNGDVTSPIIIHNRSSSASHPEPPIPPDGWIPHSDQNNFITLPPPHEMDQPPPSPSSMMTRTSWVHVPSMHASPVPEHRSIQSASPAIHRRTFSVPTSPVSTTLSHFDIVSTNPDKDASPRGRKLSMIPEGSSRGDSTPTMSGRRSRTEALTTPGLETDYGYSPATDMTLRSPAVAEFVDANKDIIYQPNDSRGRSVMQRFADELRYSDPDIADSWRRSAVPDELVANHPPRHRPAHITTPHPLSPPSSTFPSYHLHSSSRTTSSHNSGIPITIQPPSTPHSFDFEQSHTPGMLSPHALPKERPPSNSSQESLLTELNNLGPPTTLQPAHPSSMYASGSRTPRTLSPFRDEHLSRRRSKSTPRDSPGRSQTSYAPVMPTQGNFNYSSPSNQATVSKPAPPIGVSRSDGSTNTLVSIVPGGMQERSLSMNAGMTPAYVSLGLSDSKNNPLRRMPSATSSITSSIRSGYKAYDPKEYVDPAFLASSENLHIPDVTAPAPASRPKGTPKIRGWSLLSRP